MVSLLASLCIGIVSASGASAAGAQRRDAQACVSLSDLDQAIAACTRIIERGPARVRATALNQRGRALTQKRDYDAAIRDFDEAIRLEGRDGALYNNRGWVYLTKEQYDLAIRDYDEAIRLNPGFAPAHANRGWAYANKGDVDRALADVDDALKLDPRFVDAYRYRGSVRFTKGDREGAIRDINEALRLSPNNIQALWSRGYAYAQMGELDRAMHDFDEIIRIDPKNPFGYFQRGTAQLRKGDVDLAIRDYSEAIWLNSGFRDALAARAGAYLVKGDAEHALHDYDEAIRLGQPSAALLSGRGLVYLRLGDEGRAFADARDAVRLERGAGSPPTDADAAIVLGNMLRENKQFDKCAEVYSKGIAGIDAAKKDDWEIFYFRGICFERSEHWDEAERDLRRAYALNPDQPDVLNYLGYSLVDRGAGVDEGMRLIGRAAEPRPDDGYILDSLGWAFYRKGNYQEALRRLERAGELKPGDPNIHGHLGDAYWRLGRRGDAVAQWSRAKALGLQPAEMKLIDERLRDGLPDDQRPAVATAVAVPRAETSAAPVAAGRRVALVIGNAAYSGVAVLPNPRRDAEVLAATLRGIGFQSVRLEADLQRDRLVETLRTFAREAETADWAVVYFAGHGLELAGTNYLIPVDARLETDRDVQFEAIALDQVLAAVEGARKLRLVILDACRDNPFARQMRRTTAARSVGRGLGRVEPQGGTLVAYAAKDGEVALDGAEGNSPFVAAMVRYLPTPGIEIGKLFRLVRDDVMTATGRKQEPFVYGSLPGEDFYFVAK